MLGDTTRSENKSSTKQINAPGEQAVVFMDPLQWLLFTKSNKSWSRKRLLRSTQVKQRM